MRLINLILALNLTGVVFGAQGGAPTLGSHFPELRHSSVKLTGLRDGVADLGSETIRILVDGKRVSLGGDLVATYQTLRKQWAENPSCEIFKQIIALVEHLAKQYEKSIHTLKLGSTFQDQIADLQKMNLDYTMINEAGETAERYLEARGVDPAFGSLPRVIYVTGGGVSYYPKAFSKVLSNFKGQGRKQLDLLVTEVMTVALKAAKKEPEGAARTHKFAQKLTVVFKPVLAHLNAEFIFASILGQKFPQYGNPGYTASIYCWQTAGGSNPGFGIQVGSKAYELTLDSVKVNELIATLNGLIKTEYDAIGADPKLERCVRAYRRMIEATLSSYQVVVGHIEDVTPPVTL